jgi:type VI secretion system protein ImpH
MPSPDLTQDRFPEALEEAPETFPFFQAVRLLQRFLPDGVKNVGQGIDPSREPVRFSVNPSLSFPAGDVQDFRARDGAPPEMVVNFLGLVGHMGVLPTHYSRMIPETNSPDPKPNALRDFLDLFHHRMVSLFYRAWERSHFFVPLERGDADWMTERLNDLIGLGLENSRESVGVEAEALLPYSGLLAAIPRSALSLQAMIEAYFDVPAEVEQFQGGWYRISEAHQCRIDDDEGLGGRLGEAAALGDEIWDPRARALVRIGPLTLERYRELVKGGRSWADLQGLIRYFGDGQVDIDVQLVLKREDVPGIVLGSEDESSTPLGLGSWICTRPRTQDADETVLSI